MKMDPSGDSKEDLLVLSDTFLNSSRHLSKEQKPNWPLHVPSLVFAYNAIPNSGNGYQPYKLMFGHKAPTVCGTWLRLAKYNDQYSEIKSAWVNKQHELILPVN